MNTQTLLGIDIGTTATKIILIDLEGKLQGEVSLPATLISPQPNFAEEDPLEWWQNVCQGVPRCLEEAGVSAEEVLAVGVSGMVPTLILVAEDGLPLRRSIQQNDARSHVEIDFFKSQVDEKAVFQKTGSAITQQSIGPKLLWLAKNEPEVFAKTWKVMGSYNYINFRLTGQPTLEQNWALESGLFDLHRQDWDDELLALSHIRRDQLPPVHAPSEVIGKINAEAARQTGLKQGTPVVAGSADHVASAFSVGLKENGDLLVKLGGAGDILYSLDRLEIDERLFLDYHVIPGLYLINGCMASSGSIIKWFRNQFAPNLDYSDLDREAEGIPAGSDGLILLPYFIGEKTPIFDPLARGMFFGLTLQHTRAHLYHAILEGISFGFLHHIQVMRERGWEIRRVRVANGGARSQLWRQVTADVIGYPLEEVAHHPGSSLGAAFVAGMGVGAFAGWGEIERYIKISNITRPNLNRHERYLQLFELYRQLYQDNQRHFQTIARIQGVSG
ncbi:MAG: FGGY-family carbohydrate kinase [Anaerolineales bacterium]|nr:FGGY-family carbohydrate kinase [Anaerolineales bacterium]MDW8447188.1 FGGY-family carbohydrate kinase [Anaerolineales bacterium]